MASFPRMDEYLGVGDTMVTESSVREIKGKRVRRSLEWSGRKPGFRANHAFLSATVGLTY